MSDSIKPMKKNKLFSETIQIFNEDIETDTKEAPRSVDLMKETEFMTGFDELGQRKMTKIGKPQWAEMIKNFEAKARGKEIAFNYGHRPDQKAAGWIKRLSVTTKDDKPTLVADVKWTPAANKAIIEGEWKYTSAEFTMQDVNQDTKKPIGAVLYGAGLTNEPHVKRMESLTQFDEGDQEMGDHKKEMEDMKKEMEELKKKNKELMDHHNKKKKMDETDDTQTKVFAELAAVKNQLEVSNLQTEIKSLFAEGKLSAAQLQKASEMKEPTELKAVIEFAKIQGNIKTQEISTGNANEPTVDMAKDFEKISSFMESRSNERNNGTYYEMSEQGESKIDDLKNAISSLGVDRLNEIHELQGLNAKEKVKF